MHVVLQNKITCPACNAEVEIADLTQDEITCEFCDTKIKIPDENKSPKMKPIKKTKKTKKESNASDTKKPAKKTASSDKKKASEKPAASAKKTKTEKKTAAKEQESKPETKKSWTGAVTTRPMSVILQDDLSKAATDEPLDNANDPDLDLDIVEGLEDEKDVRLRTETENSYAKRIRDFRKIGEDATAYMTALDFADEYPGSFNAWRFLFEMENSPELRRSHLEKMRIVASTDKEQSYLVEKAPLVLRKDQANAQKKVDEAESKIEELKVEHTQLMKSHALMKPEEWKTNIENELAANIQTMKKVKPQLDELQAKQKSGSNPHIYLFMILGVILGGIIGFAVDSHPLTIFIGAVAGFAISIVACLIFSVFFAVNRANKISVQMTTVQDYMDKLNEREENLLDQQRKCRRVFDIADEISELQDEVDAGYAEIDAIEQSLEKLEAKS